MARRPPVRIRASEQGIVMLTVLFLLLIMSLLLAAAAPKVAKEIQRDREVETIERGKQYARGIKMYYRKMGAYPPNLDLLVKPTGPGNLRFLRKKYLDPLTGKDDWKPIPVGMNKAPTAMAFFGQPLMGTSTGMGAMGGGQIAGASTIGSPISSSPSDTSSSSSGASTGTTGGTTTATAGSSMIGTSGTGTSGTTGTTGQTFGGAGIMGFEPVLQKQSILVYKTKKHYNEWEFVYDPLADRITIPGGNNLTSGSAASSGTGSTTNGTTPTGTSGIGISPTGSSTGISSSPQ